MTLSPAPGSLSSSPLGTVRPQGKWRRRWILVGLGLLVLSLLVLVGAPNPQDGSTYSRGLTGYRSWYERMQQQDLPIKRWQRPYEQLSGTDQTLLQIWGGGQEPPKGPEQAAIRTWVEQGNTVITLFWQGRATAAPFASALESSAGLVQVETTRRHQPHKNNVALLADDYGEVVWSQPHGQGKTVETTYPWLAANVFADREANFNFLRDLAQTQGGTIWVDEWLHGYRDPGVQSEALPQDQTLLDYLGRTPLAVIALQGGLMILVLIWGQNHRFGVPVSTTPPTPDNSSQYIQALAGTLNQAGHTEFVLGLLSVELRQILGVRLGLVASYGDQQVLPQDQQLANQWSETTGRPAQELLELLEQGRQTRRRSDRDLLNWVTRAESILRETP